VAITHNKEKERPLLG